MKLDEYKPDPLRWKRWYHFLLPFFLSCGLTGLILGLALHVDLNIYLGACCLGGFIGGIRDPEIRGRHWWL